MSKSIYLFTAVLQLLVVGLLWVVVMVELLLNKALERLSGCLLSPRSRSVLGKIVNSRPVVDPQDGIHTDNTTEADKEIKDVLYLLKKRSSYLLNIDRKAFENTDAGRTVKAKHLDRHLYAVLRPTRTENLRRIENVLRAMAPDRLRHLAENAREDMRLWT